MRRTVAWCGAAAAVIAIGLTADQALAGQKTAAEARAAKASPAEQVTYDGRADVTYALDRTSDGALVLVAQRGTLTLTKTVRADGTFALELRDGPDEVSFAVTTDRIDVARRGKRLRLDVARATDEDYIKVRGNLANSRAIRAARRMAADLGPTLETPEGMGLLLADAFIGYLDGDVAAPARAARALRDRYSRGHQAVRLASCYDRWEHHVVRYWDDVVACFESFGIWNPMRQLCSFRWTLQVETAWFSLMSCVAFPWPI
jgi:hypothetical protein